MQAIPLPCKNFLNGWCGRGKDCRFQHVAADPMKLIPCKNFLNGRCGNGKDCRFQHVDADRTEYGKRFCRLSEYVHLQPNAHRGMAGKQPPPSAPPPLPAQPAFQPSPQPQPASPPPLPSHSPSPAQPFSQPLPQPLSQLLPQPLPQPLPQSTTEPLAQSRTSAAGVVAGSDTVVASSAGVGKDVGAEAGAAMSSLDHGKAQMRPIGLLVPLQNTLTRAPQGQQQCGGTVTAAVLQNARLLEGQQKELSNVFTALSVPPQ